MSGSENDNNEVDEDADSFAEDEAYEYDNGDDDDDDEVDDEDDANLNNTQNSWLEDHYKLKRWETKDAELRLALANDDVEVRETLCDKTAGGLRSVTTAESAKTQQRAFSSSASFKVLAKDLLAIQHAADAASVSSVRAPMRVVADAIEDNLYHWNVKLSCFPPGSQLAAGLRRLERLHGYDYIELEVRYTINLYPFFPPLVRIVRPRFSGGALVRVSQLSCLQLSSWDVVRGMAPVFEAIGSALGETGVVMQVDDVRNDPWTTPSGAYTELEHELIRLGLLTEVPPRLKRPSQQEAAEQPTEAPSDAASSSVMAAGDLSGLLSPPGEAKPKVGAKVKAAYWAKGTGYGHDDQKAPTAWDVEAFVAAQREQDSLVGQLLRSILTKLGSGTTEELLEPSVLTALAQSSLLPVLAGYARNESLVEASRHADLYKAALRLISAIARRPELGPLLCLDAHDATPPFQDDDDDSDTVKSGDSSDTSVRKRKRRRTLPNSLEGLVGAMAKRVAAFNMARKKGVYSLEQQEPAPEETTEQPAAAAAATQQQQRRDARRWHYDPKTAQAEDESSAELMALMEEAVKDVQEAVARVDVVEQQQEEDEPLAATKKKRSDSVEEAGSAASERRYAATLRPLQYDDATDELAEAWTARDPAVIAAAAGAPLRPPPQRVVVSHHPAMLRRLAQEHADLSQSLPLNESSSAWVRTHPERMDVLQIAISAPDQTPYSAGLFIFEVRFPPQYPASPPSMKLLTTGRGTVRFNPNLYECGKVCLSLLGTWEGKQGETWNEKTSTLLQAVVSIQSLIFVPDPYFNEPGYEKQMGTLRGDERSAQYAAVVKEGTIRWAMLDQLRAPEQPDAASGAAFRDVAKAHFALRKDYVLAQIDEWIVDARKRAKDARQQPPAQRPPPPPEAPPTTAPAAASSITPPAAPTPTPEDALLLSAAHLTILVEFFEKHATTLTGLRTELLTLLDQLPQPTVEPASS